MKKIITFVVATFISLSVFSGTIIPYERDVSRIDVFSYIMSSNASSSFYLDMKVGDQNDNLYFHGFRFENQGPNDVVPTSPDDFYYAYRNFSFINTDKARRENYLWITDHNGSGRVSDLYETVLVFLPRENQMHIEENGENLIVTLNNGEEIQYTKHERKIISGVLKEEPVDFNPDRDLRSHARVRYTGEGIVLRSDARGADPRLGGKIQILRKDKEPCIAEGELFWTQSGFPKFKYVTDDEAYKVIESVCGKEFLE